MDDNYRNDLQQQDFNCQDKRNEFDAQCEKSDVSIATKQPRQKMHVTTLLSLIFCTILPITAIVFSLISLCKEKKSQSKYCKVGAITLTIAVVIILVKALLFGFGVALFGYVFYILTGGTAG